MSTIFKVTFITDFIVYLTKPNEFINPEIKTIYIIVLKDFLKEEHKEINHRDKRFKSENLKTLRDKILWMACVLAKLLKSVRI